MSDSYPTAAAAARDLRATGADFHRRGWSLGTSSNYSVVLEREPLTLLITASGKHKGELGTEDFVRVDERGRPIADGQPKPSAETLLHVELARQPEVGAVLHTHSVHATVLSQTDFEDGGVTLDDYEMLKGLQRNETHEHREWVPIFDNTQDIAELAEELARQLADPGRTWHHGFLLRQHGLYTWGPDLAAARRHVEVLEFLFECVVRRRTLDGRR